MLLVNIMVALSAIIYYTLINQYSTLNAPMAIALSIVVFLLANGPQMLKVQLYKDKAPSMLSRLIGTAVVLFILGLSWEPYFHLWSLARDGMEYAILAWIGLVAIFMVTVPLLTVHKIDRIIAGKIEQEIIG